MGAESSWNADVYRLGLLNWGFDCVARLLEVGPEPVYLTNRVTFGLAAVVSIDTFFRRWVMIPNGVQTFGRPFPYGRLVNPP